MFVVIVRLRVRPGRIDAFLDGIEANARAARSHVNSFWTPAFPEDPPS
ncbi:hypothetical protein SAMN05444920_1517 [Nonomuraea solani]|uniref:Antibiotic biosynthesis monooxygenase n=1 Tax=Nonomuraea solani TaxID=1144553 RepID=A0A1H6F4R9_9ACTN|nr:hypothetical protein [Nonomuraea solani]SEH03984.1 hypothetical protein SAMN05444920_1517 [Nonomuraea solani]